MQYAVLCTCVSCVTFGEAMQGLEVYSTVLWHMKREVEVSYLAQEAIAQDRRSPHAWAIMGNCFSLQKVHTALCCNPIGNCFFHQKVHTALCDSLVANLDWQLVV